MAFELNCKLCATAGAVGVAANMSTERVGLEALVLEQHMVVATLAAQMAASQGLTPTSTAIGGNANSGKWPGQGTDGQPRSSSVGRAGRGRAGGASSATAGDDAASGGQAGLKNRPSRPISASNPGDSAAAGPGPAAALIGGSSGAKGPAAHPSTAGAARVSSDSTPSRFHCYLWVLVANCCSHPVLGHAIASQSDAVAALASAACSIPPPPIGSAATRRDDIKAASTVPPEVGEGAKGLDEQAGGTSLKEGDQNTPVESSWLGRSAGMMHMSVLGAWQQLLGGCPWPLLSTLRRCSSSGGVAGAEAVALHVLPLVGWVEAALLADAAAAGMLNRPCRDRNSRGSSGTASRAESLSVSATASPRGHLQQDQDDEELDVPHDGSAPTKPNQCRGQHGASAVGPNVWNKVAVSALSVAGAAAGMVALAIAAELVSELPRGLERQMLPWLTQLMLLPTLPAVKAVFGRAQMAGPLGLSTSSNSYYGGRLGTTLAVGGSGALEHAAAQAALCCWALTTNLSCGPSWGIAVAADTALPLVMLELVASFQGGGTRARYSPARIMPSLCLGQLAVLDLLQPEVVELVVQRESGVLGALGDATLYALLPDRGQQHKQQQAAQGKEKRGGKSSKGLPDRSPVAAKARGKGEKGLPPAPLDLPRVACSPYLAAGGGKVPRSPTAAAGMNAAAGGGFGGHPADSAALGNARTDREKGGKWGASDPAEFVALQALTRLGLGGPLRGLVGLQAAGAIAHLAAAATAAGTDEFATAPSSKDGKSPEKPGPPNSGSTGSGGRTRATASPRFATVPGSVVSALVALLGSSIHGVQLAGSMALTAVAAGSHQAAAAVARQAGFMEKMRQILQTATDGRVSLGCDCPVFILFRNTTHALY